MERAEQLAKSFFERLGYRVEEIPTSGPKTADLRVHDGQTTYIVEVKEKAHADSQIDYSTVVVGEESVNVRQEPHSTSNRVDGVFKYAAKQLADTPCDEGDIKLIWLHSNSRSAAMTISRVLYTFYGIAQLVPRSQAGNGINCVYFYNSTAFSCPHVDGLIVVENDLLQLCMNEFSDNFRSLKSSNLVHQLGDAVYDPTSFDDKPGTIVFRSEISRKDESKVLNELQRSTGVTYSVIQLSSFEYS